MTQDIQCNSCGASLHFESAEISTSCPFCGSNQFHAISSNTGPLPEFIVPFRCDQRTAAHIATRWVRKRGPFVDSRFKYGKLRSIKGVYLPTFLYNLEAHAEYRATIGNRYYTGSGKNRRVKYENFRLSGCYSRYLYDVFVSASRSITNNELQQIEPFDTRQLRHFLPQYLSGWAAEHVTQEPEIIDANAKGEFQSFLAKYVRSHLPGDRVSEVSVSSRFVNLQKCLTLVPVWIFAVRMAPDRDPIRIFVNGQTGAVTGNAPISATKVTAVTIALAFVAWMLFNWLGGK